MIFYSPQVYIALALIAPVFLLSIYFQFARKNTKVALWTLLLGGFALRLLMISLDPYLHDWDERFHALVARNMVAHPLRPMLRLDPVIPYKIEDWCCNHIWVHKQPLFLWQMAASLKIFGANEIAARLPTALMGTMSIFFVHDIARLWTRKINVAYLAALLFALSYYQLELTSGQFPLDHNDVAFAFYVTASTWAFVRYLGSEKWLKWSVIVGFLVGCAVLNKWLTGLLVFGGWGLYELLALGKAFRPKRWVPLLVAVVVSLVVFVPWQLYILEVFPLESKIMFEHNRRHIFEVLDDRVGSAWYHVQQLNLGYGDVRLVIPLALVGWYALFRNRRADHKLSASLLAMVVVIFAFFSLVVQTKMPAFTHPVHAIIWTTLAAGLVFLLERIWRKVPVYVWVVTAIAGGAYVLQPIEIARFRAADNVQRNAKIHNTRVYISVALSGELADRVIFNCKQFEDVEMMFYRNVNAYQWYPEEAIIDSLLREGVKLAAFTSHGNQQLPAYISDNPAIFIIPEKLK